MSFAYTPAPGAPPRSPRADVVADARAQDLWEPVAEVGLPTLSDEQQRMVDTAMAGHDVIVEATVGSGKTATIQALCSLAGRDREVLYLTYSKLLKADAQRRVTGARVQNYHGVVYPSLLAAGLSCGISESIRVFNDNFRDLSADFPRYDMMVVDEYQDINEEYARLLLNIKSLNPLMQVVMVGDLEQRVRADTTLDVQAFVRELCEDPVHLPFTASFRMGPVMGDLLGQAWNKPIVGANQDQRVRTVDTATAVEILEHSDPGEILCLGSRTGKMSQVLNEVERRFPEKYNKGTVYASIKDGDMNMSYGPDAAVFTTFDSSKGLERPTCLVFDYDEGMWDLRNKFPNADHEVLRNVFLVAASRGKQQIVFVTENRTSSVLARIGSIPVKRFQELPEKQRPIWNDPWWASDVFDFKYAENVETCFDLLRVERLDAGLGPEIAVERADGLIDLSPTVGSYQEAAFFEGWDAFIELAQNPSDFAQMMLSELTGEPWRDCLVMTAVNTEQERYVQQVEREIPQEVTDELVARLSTQLRPEDASQVSVGLSGRAVHSRTVSTPIKITGVIDAVHDGVPFELKFVHELTHPMFLQLALYLVMGGHERGVLWNVRTDERWGVEVPDVQRFMDAVVLCVTKQEYRVFAGALP